MATLTRPLPSGRQIAFNGAHFADFHHRMPLESVTHVGAEGEVHINNVNGVRLPNEPDHVIHTPVRTPP